MRTTFGALIAVLTALITAEHVSAQTLSQEWEWCAKLGVNISPDLQISGCTTVIESGLEDAQYLPIAFDNRGNAFEDKGEHLRAIRDYNEAIRLKPDFAKAFADRGTAFNNKGEYDRAIQDYNEAIRLKPDYAQAFNKRGIAYSDIGEYDRAIQDYDEAIRLKPDYAQAFNNRGNTFNDKGGFDRAIQDYNEAIRLKPDYAQAFNNRGAAYHYKGEYDPAIQDYNEAIRLRPDYAQAFNNRGNAHRNKSEFDQAIQDYSLAIQLRPKDSNLIRARGIIRFYLRQFGASQKDFVLALRLCPTDAYSVVWAYLAQMQESQDARVELEKHAAALKLMEWPGQVISFYLGKTSRELVLSAAKDPDSKRERDKLCESNFFLGEYSLLSGDRAEAVRLFHEVLATGAADNFAYVGAQVELRRLLGGAKKLPVRLYKPLNGARCPGSSLRREEFGREFAHVAVRTCNICPFSFSSRLCPGISASFATIFFFSLAGRGCSYCSRPEPHSLPGA